MWLLFRVLITGTTQVPHLPIGLDTTDLQKGKKRFPGCETPEVSALETPASNRRTYHSLARRRLQAGRSVRGPTFTSSEVSNVQWPQKKRGDKACRKAGKTVGFTCQIRSEQSRMPARNLTINAAPSDHCPCFEPLHPSRLLCPLQQALKTAFHTSDAGGAIRWWQRTWNCFNAASESFQGRSRGFRRRL